MIGILIELVLKMGGLFLSGLLLVSPFPQWHQQSRPIRSFFAFAVGMLIGISLLAIYGTNGQSILLFFPLIYVLLLVKYGSFKSIKLPFDLMFEFGLLLVVAGLCIGIQIIRHHPFADDVFYFLDVDFGIYVAIAEYLVQTGSEISSPWYNSSLGLPLLAPQPYHYADLWLASYAILPLTEAAPLHKYLFLFIPITLSLCFASFQVLASLLAPVKSYHSIALLLLLFLLLFYGIYYPPQPQIARGLLFNSLTVPKTLGIYLGFASAAFFWQRAQYSWVIFALAILPILNILFLPAVLTAIACILAYLFFFRKMALSTLFWWALIPLGILAYIFGFYTFLGSLFIGLKAETFTLPTYIFRFFRGLTSGALRFMVFNSWLLLPAYFLFRFRKKWDKQFWEISAIGGFLLFGGLLGKALLNNRSSEADQLFYVITIPILTCLLALSIGVLFHSGVLPKRVRSGLSIFFFVILAIPFVSITSFFPNRDHQVSKAFVEQVQSALQFKNPLGAYIPNPDTQNVYTSDPRMSIPSYFLKLIGPNYWVHHLALPDDLRQIPFPEKENATRIAPFFRFLQQHKTTGRWQGYEHAQIDFINMQKIDFLVLEKGARLPEKIKACTTTYLLDPISGHQVIILQRPCAY